MQLALTYSPTNVAIYTNGVLLATACLAPVVWTNTNFLPNFPPVFETGPGVVYSPSPAGLTEGFYFGNMQGPCPVLGQLDELETFNYPLTAQAIAAGFPTFAGNATNVVMADTNYVGRSDMLQHYVDGTNTVQCRLGYWRFDTPWLYSEQGQMPKSQSGVTLSNSWSGTAANIGSGSGSQLTYWDVYTNGWANINCRQGCLRFWFRPNWNSNAAPVASAPFVFLGTNLTPANSEWSLQMVNYGGAIQFVTASNGTNTVNIAATTYGFSSNHWCQIALNYGPTNSTLFINGAPAASGSGVTYWPTNGDRARGLVIGNNTGSNACINGQFEEMETFNYQLSSNDIAANFAIVSNVDSDLNGIPDLLEDIQLSNSRPFLGAPVVITGTIEAEQFDIGGTNVGYHTNVANNVTNAYRKTGMCITSCDDNLGTGTTFGYCLDQTHAGDWAQYTINVLVPQTYMVEVRAEPIGGNLGGVFQCDFTNGVGVLINSAGISNSTGQMTITNSGWTNYSKVVYLTNGINVMTLHCLSNAPSTSYVGRFNYISIYPWWQAGFTSGTNISVSGLSTNNDYADALANANAIQFAIGMLPSNGGTVFITNGLYYVVQGFPNEANGAWQNAAISISTNNIEIAGAGKSKTTLIGYNRATTVLCLGQTSIGGSNRFADCNNFTLRDLTIEGQPHWAVSNTAGTNIIYDTNQLVSGQTNDMNPSVINGQFAGAATVFYQIYGGYQVNILITNCQFLYAVNPITLGGMAISNVLVRSNDFTMWGGANTNFGNVGIFGEGYNFVVIENTFNGNTNLTPSTNEPVGYDSKSVYDWIAACGLVWFQSGGNFFVARNSITNYSAEAVQLDDGPNAVVGNTLYTLVSSASTCALNVAGNGVGSEWGGPSDLSVENSTCFIGNWIYGGRYGQKAPGTDTPYSCNFSGNYLTLVPPFDESGDCPGAAVLVWGSQAANVCGNTMVTGGYGFQFAGGCSSALVLNNIFSNVTYRGIGYWTGGDSLSTAQIFGNMLGQGVSFHVQLPYTNSFGWFLKQNTYLNPSENSVPAFTDPLSSAAHISNHYHPVKTR
jgi:hypothetical protein